MHVKNNMMHTLIRFSLRVTLLRKGCPVVVVSLPPERDSSNMRPLPSKETLVAPAPFRTNPVGAPRPHPTPDEESYVIQGMEFKLGADDFVQEDVIRLLHIFSALISPQSELTLDIDSLAHRLGEIQREFKSDKAIEDALEDSAGFEMPTEVWQRDTEAYHMQGSSLIDMIGRSLATHTPDRFNHALSMIVSSRWPRLVSLSTP